MSYKNLICTFLLFHNVAFADNCIFLPLSYHVMFEDSIFVAFKVIDKQPSDVISDIVDIEVIQEFNSDIIENTIIRVSGRKALGPIGQFTPNTEWLSVINIGEEGDYFFPLCAPSHAIENGIIIGDTGINALDESNDDITFERFALVLDAYHQGISSADTVCTADNSYCEKTQATYNFETGILDLPSVLLLITPFINSYAEARMKKTGDNPVTFTIIE